MPIYLPQTPPGSLFWRVSLHSKHLSSEGLGGTLKVDLEGHHLNMQHSTTSSTDIVLH